MRPVHALAGLAVVAVLIGGFLFWTRGAQIRIEGKVLKVRTHALDENSSLMVVDFRFANPADYPFVIRSVDLIVETAEGASKDGMMVAESDAQRIFKAIPDLGQKYNETLKTRDRIPAHAEEDRMVAARFEIPIGTLNARKAMRIRVVEVDGAVSQMSEER
ncbi:MAG: hypothetical protein R2729_05030 [Bryobacteraceae bacterium]